MANEYTITRIVSVNDAQFGKKRITFMTHETGEKFISTFSQYPDSIQAGKKIFGSITEKQQNDRTYYNFAFAKKDEPQAIGTDNGNIAWIRNALTLKVIPMLEEIYKKVMPDDYPEFNDTNDAHTL